MRLSRKFPASGAFVPWMLALLVGLHSGGAFAAPPDKAADTEGLQLAKSRVCLGCHQPESKLVGPAFSAVAQRYGSLEDPVGYLSQSIRAGGRGRWGAVPMPAQPQVSESDARRLAQWILTLR